MASKLQGRVALITGAGRGIGQAISCLFAAEGASLMLASRTAEELERTARECRARGAACEVGTCDVSDREAVQRLVDSAMQRFERIDVLVNAAGIYGPIGPAVEVDAHAWMRTLEVNTFGTFNVCQAVLPHMMARGGGRIVNFSGGGAATPLPRFSAYAVSKAAVVRLTETLAEEVKARGITINAISPGFIDTQMQDEVLRAGEAAGDLLGRVRALRETGAGKTPIDVPAKLALFLASDDSRDLTGRVLAAPHDGWEHWDAEQIDALAGTPWFTLRRIDPFTIEPLRDKRP
ncbi:MAG TPA: SDR family NAD(P)-dependent oxidoreductase [Dehalococcoidia bacterium]|nr:SDR family NAD(P)-dependent oxidoreductase [Dehalococcoidia bacterium]